MSFSFYKSKKPFFLRTRKFCFTSCKPNDLSCVKNQEPVEFRRQGKSRYSDINKRPHMSACSHLPKTFQKLPLSLKKPSPWGPRTSYKAEAGKNDGPKAKIPIDSEAS